MRAGDADPLKMCTFETGTATPTIYNNRRVGRPRGKWAMDTYTYMWTKHHYGNVTQVRANKNAAIQRMQPDIIDRNI